METFGQKQDLKKQKKGGDEMTINSHMLSLSGFNSLAEMTIIGLLQ